MIRDAKGRKWFMRFKQYSNGWQWEARTPKELGLVSDLFATKAEAEADARSYIPNHDPVARMDEYFRRWRMRGTECQLTDEDYEAIERAGMNKR